MNLQTLFAFFPHLPPDIIHSFDYDLPNDTAYSESCAAIALAFFARRMLEIQPKSEYADVMESALYNTTLAGMALDGKSFFYVNPLEVVPEACHRDERKAHVKPVRQKWFGCACCPPNIARIVEDVQQYAYTIGDDSSTLYVHLYMGGGVHARLSGTDVRLDVMSDMPWSGKGSVAVGFDAGESASDASKDAVFTIALRLPAWAGGETASDAVTVRGRDDISRVIRDGYLYLTGAWHDGDVVDFDFPMPVHMVAANPLVREDAGKVAFVRGPLAYCAEGVDNGANLHLLHADTARIASDPSCVAWSIRGETNYCLEGSVFNAGSTVQWMRDELHLISSAEETQALAESVPDHGGVYLVSAFTGLGAPYWDMYARGTLVGITRGTTRAHVVRAGLEGIAYQVRDLIDAMEKDAGAPMQILRVDGGASVNRFLMQFQADVLRCPIDRPVMVETTALGAAFLAGLHAGVWSNVGDIVRIRESAHIFRPKMDAESAQELCRRWHKAVERAKDWE